MLLKELQGYITQFVKDVPSILVLVCIFYFLQFSFDFVHNTENSGFILVTQVPRPSDFSKETLIERHIELPYSLAKRPLGGKRCATNTSTILIVLSLRRSHQT